MKERGKVEFDNQNYNDSIDYFSHAIDIIQLQMPSGAAQFMAGNETQKHELAVLYSSRSECQMKLKNVDKALADASDSVAWDGNWYQVRTVRMTFYIHQYRNNA